MEDQDELVKTVKDISDKHWAERATPLLLSAMPSLLEEKVPGYKALLGHRTLKSFVKETGDAAGYRLVEHPTQRARVGVAPAMVPYEFPSEAPRASGAIASNENKEATLAFFRALATLPAADLDKMVFPASVLVKLLK